MTSGDAGTRAKWRLAWSVQRNGAPAKATTLWHTIEVLLSGSCSSQRLPSQPSRSRQTHSLGRRQKPWPSLQSSRSEQSGSSSTLSGGAASSAQVGPSEVPFSSSLTAPFLRGSTLTLYPWSTLIERQACPPRRSGRSKRSEDSPKSESRMVSRAASLSEQGDEWSRAPFSRRTSCLVASKERLCSRSASSASCSHGLATTRRAVTFSRSKSSVRRMG
mmetsp:Transcript_107416/g.231273  ORF Transcript_107416/g.231273 Transcript_107416/m.231273 type:complete len:218 (+) Transcript_107416:494-1147(+)